MRCEECGDSSIFIDKGKHPKSLCIECWCLSHNETNMHEFADEGDGLSNRTSKTEIRALLYGPCSPMMKERYARLFDGKWWFICTVIKGKELKLTFAHKSKGEAAEEVNKFCALGRVDIKSN